MGAGKYLCNLPAPIFLPNFGGIDSRPQNFAKTTISTYGWPPTPETGVIFILRNAVSFLTVAAKVSANAHLPEHTALRGEHVPLPK